MSMAEVSERLRELEKEGRLDPQDVVDDARDESSPLHPFFEWDDNQAAAAYRLGQARQLIRRVKIEVTVRDVPLECVRYVKEPGDLVYRDIRAVRNDTDIARDVVIGEMQRVVKAAKRAKAVAAVLGTAENIEQIIEIAREITDRSSAISQAAGEA